MPRCCAVLSGVKNEGRMWGCAAALASRLGPGQFPLFLHLTSETHTAFLTLPAARARLNDFHGLHMAATPALRLKAQPPGSLLSISQRLRPSLRQRLPAWLAHRPSSLLATRLPTHTRPFSRPFMSSPPRPGSEEQQPKVTRSIGGEEWEALSPEAKIKWLLGDDADGKWGWVIYRCTYTPALDGQWEDFKRLVVEQTRKAVAESDAPEIADKLDWVFIEDPALEGASLDELKRRFRTWARAESPNWDIDNAPNGRGSRHTYFIQVDQDALSSGEVNIVRGWQDPLPPEEAFEETGEPVDNEDWMKIQRSMLAPYFYVEMDNDEFWYAHYRPPSHGVRLW